MKRTVLLLPVWGILILCFAIPSPTRAADSRRREKDSLRLVIAKTEGADRLKAYKTLSQLYEIEVRREGVIDTLLTLYDAMETEARKMGDIKQQGLIRCWRVTALANKSLYDEVIRQAPSALDFLAENESWRNYYQLSSILVDAYRRTKAYDKALETANGVYEHAQAHGDRGGMGVAMHDISRIYTIQRRFPEAEKCLRESIAMMQDETPYANLLATASNHLVMNLISQERYDEAEQAARDTEAVNRRYEAAAKGPQASAWINLYLSYIDLYRQSGQYDKAQTYLDKLDSMTKGSFKMYKERGHVFLGKRRYREALEMLDKAIRKGPDSLDSKSLKLMTLIRMGEPEKAIRQFYELVGDMETLRNMEYNAQLDEIRTQYEVDKYVAEKERNFHYFLFSLGLCLFLLLLLAGVFYYNRVIAAKNRNLYDRIREQDRLADELSLLTQAAAPAGGGAGTAPGALPGSDQQLALVARLREYLLADNRLSSTDLGRDEITTALGTNKNALTEAVKAVTGKTPMEYMRALRIDEARRMLDAHPELTIDAVADSCGFSIPSTFYRLFRKQYGISPSEYRKLAASRSDA